MIISGNVQNVGFRFTVPKIASHNNIVGYVKNLEDGTVEILCEGEDNNINRFIEEIKKLEEPITVNGIDIRDIKPTERFKEFKIVMGSLEEELVKGLDTGAMYMQLLMNGQNKLLGEMCKAREGQTEIIKELREAREGQTEIIKELRETREEAREGQTKTTTAIHTLAKNMHDMIDSRFERMEKEIKTIRTELDRISHN